MDTIHAQTLDYGVLGHTIYSLIIIFGGSVCTAALAYWGVWKKIIEPGINKREEEKKLKALELSNIVKNQQTLFEHIESMTKQLVDISSELKPNGGGSLKDLVTKIHSNVKYILSERDAEFQLSKSAMFRNDNIGNCTGANKALTELFGGTEEQLLGHGWVNFIVESDRERAKEEWVNVVDGGTEISSSYMITNPLTEETFPIKYRAIINRSPHDGHIISILGLVEKLSKKQSKIS